MYIIGISAYYHDSAACLIHKGEILSAAQEERFTRKKNDSDFPIHTIKWLLQSHQLTWDDIDAIVFYEKPFISFERIIENFLQYAPKGFANFKQALPLWIKKKLFLERTIKRELEQHFPHEHFPTLYYSEHHLSHAASSFYPSPFDEALIVTLDGVGEWATTGIFWGNKNKITPIKEIDFPHSLGLLYCALTSYLGFKVNSGEYKVMGLAPYGTPRYYQLLKDHLVTLHPDGSYQLNLDYFGHTYHQQSFTPKLEELLANKARSPEANLEQFHMDVAASLQKLLEELLLHLLNALSLHHKTTNLCLAGGVALNCVANSKIKNHTPFKNIWIQPAAGDAGACIGAALAFYHLHHQRDRIIQFPDGQKNSTLGPRFTSNDIEEFLAQHSLPVHYQATEDICKETALRLANGQVAGWFQDQMEFGPRALGHRSILGDARVTDMQRRMNLKIKFRESFRPFAPIVLASDAKDIFNWEDSSPYMQFVATVKEEFRIQDKQLDSSFIERINHPRSHYPAITHLDFSARLQTVEEQDPRAIGTLLKIFKQITGRGILINTSFNIRGEPIVCTPEDAYRCFYHTDIDFLVLGNYLITRDDLKFDIRPPMKKQVELD